LGAAPIRTVFTGNKTMTSHRFPSAGMRGVAAIPLALALCASTFPMIASAEDAPSPLTDSFLLSLGSFTLDTDTEVRLDGDTSGGTPVDWENTFGDSDSTRFRIDGFWRFADRHKLRFLWFNRSRSQSADLDRDIEWGDVTYPVNARVEGEFDFDVYELAYEYAFLRRDSYEISGTFGLHYTDLAVALQGEADTGGGVIEADVREEASVGAPLPVIGLRGMWTLPYDLWIDASAQFFYLSIDEYDGSLQDYRVMLTWQPRKWAGIGIGYNRFEFDVDVDASRFQGSLNWVYQGPMLSYSVLF
jgi:hypothetical protein